VDRPVQVSQCSERPAIAQRPVRPIGAVRERNLPSQGFAEAGALAPANSGAAATRQQSTRAREARDVRTSLSPGRYEAVGPEKHPWMILEWVPTTPLIVPANNGRPRHRAMRSPWSVRFRLWVAERRNNRQT
jgi:hypothetical protein